MTTKYKHSNGLTLPAAKSPTFPSAKRYQICLEKKDSYKILVLYIEKQKNFLTK